MKARYCRGKSRTNASLTTFPRTFCTRHYGTPRILFRFTSPLLPIPPTHCPVYGPTDPTVHPLTADSAKRGGTIKSTAESTLPCKLAHYQAQKFTVVYTYTRSLLLLSPLVSPSLPIFYDYIILNVLSIYTYYIYPIYIYIPIYILYIHMYYIYYILYIYMYHYRRYECVHGHR